MREMKAKVKNIQARLRLNGGAWTMVACLFADDTVTCGERKATSEWQMNSSVCVWGRGGGRR